MPSNPFNLDFTRLDVIFLSLVPAVINIGIFLYVLISFRKTRTILYFSSFVLLIGFWQASEGLIRLSNSINTAEVWFKISIIFLVFAMPFGVEFILKLFKDVEKLKTKFISSFLFITSIVCFIIIEIGLEKHIILPSPSWYWIVNPIPNVWINFILLWVAFNGLAMMLLLCKYYLNNKNNELLKKHALLLLLGLSFPVISGIIFEMLMPLLFNANNVPVATPLVTVFSICALITINKYKIFDYSPKHQWEQIVTSLSDGILIVNNDDTVMYANDAFCRLLGYEFEEIKKRNASDLFLFPKHKAEILKVIEERKLNKISSYEVPMMTKKKETIWVMISGSPYYDQDGNIIGSIGVHTNITGLKSMNKELETFIYKASHDLRGPLASIIGLVSVSKLEGNNDNSEKYLDMIETASKKLDGTLTDLVKAMQFKEALQFSDKVYFDKMVADILNRFFYYPSFSTLQVSVDVVAEGPFITNRLIMETILQNLIENSIKYQNPEAKQPILKINILQKSDMAEITIEDNGIGIEEAAQAKIFDMYFRATNSAKGTGLGLYLVKNGIDKLKGKIELYSKPGEKTIFKVSLPVIK